MNENIIELTIQSLSTQALAKGKIGKNARFIAKSDTSETGENRETKQLTGLESCQCRLARIVRNHIACAFLVWIRLMREAHETAQNPLSSQTWYAL